MERVGYLGLGSNVGDRDEHLRAAIAGLRSHGVAVEAASSTYETEPVGEILDQPDFLNAVIRIRTSLEPEELLDLCKAVEAEAGRMFGGPRHGPRTLDVDLLLAATDADAAADLVQLEAWAGAPYVSDTIVHVGTAAGTVELLGDIRGVDGVTLRPLALPSTLPRLVENVLPVIRPVVAPATGTLRDRLGLPRPANRFASAH